VKTRALTLILVILLGLSGCGNLAIGIETTPTPDAAATATAATLAAQNAELRQTVTALQPTPTPDPAATAGLALVYEQDGKIYRGGFDGGGAQPVATLPPAAQDILYAGGYFAARSSLKLSGNRLAYGAGGTIGVIDLDTGAHTALYAPPVSGFLGSGGHDVLWSGDGAALAYAITYANNRAETPNGWTTEVGVIDLASGRQRVVASADAPGRGFALISYDAAAKRLWLTPLGGDPSLSELVAYDLGDPAAEPRRYPIRGEGEPAGSAGFLAVSAPHDFATRAAATLVYDLGAPEAEPRVIEHPSATYGSNYLWHGDRLAFLLGHGVSWQETTGVAEGVFGWDPAGGEAVELAPAALPGDMPLAWSPDGAWLASVQAAGGEFTDHWAARAGGEPLELQVAATAHVLGWTE